MAIGNWIGIDETHYHDSCGDLAGHTATEMLAVTDAWWHVVNEVHYLELDLGSQVLIPKMRFRGQACAAYAPTDVDIFVSTDGATWGTAVATGVNPFSYGADWGEVDTTDKTGRYIRLEINATQDACNSYLIWGTAALPQIDVWCGALPQKFTTIVPLHSRQLTTTSSTYAPTDGSQGMIAWDGGKYSNIIAAYLIGTGYRTGSSGGDPLPMWNMQLYDRTNSAEIGAVIDNGITAETAISSDVSANLPAGVATLDVRVKWRDAVSATGLNFYLVIVQESTADNKTRIYIPMSAYSSRPTSTYKKLSGIGVGGVSEKQFKWLDASFGDTIAGAYFSATIEANTASTFSAKLDAIGGSDAMGEVTTTNTVPTLVTSSDISSSLTDTTVYTTWIKATSARPSTNDQIYNSYLIVDIEDLTKYLTVYDVANAGRNISTAGWTEDKNQMVRYLTGTNWYTADITEVVTHSGVIAHFGDTSMGGSLYDDGVRNSTADLSTVLSVPTLLESAAITPADDSDIAIGLDLGSTGFFITGTVYDSKLMAYISGIEATAEVGSIPLRMLMGVGI